MEWEDFTFNAPHLDILQTFFPKFDLQQFAFLFECRSHDADKVLQCNNNTSCIQPGFEDLVDTNRPFEEDDAQRATPAVDNAPSAWLFPIWQKNQPSWICGTKEADDITLPKLTRVSKRHFAMYLNTQSCWMVQNYSTFGTWLNGTPLRSRTGEFSRGALNPDMPNAIIAGKLEIIIYPIHHVAAPSAHSRFVPYLPEISDMELASQTSLATTITARSESTVQPLELSTESYYYLDNRRVPVQSQLTVVMAVHKRTRSRNIAKIYRQDTEERAASQYLMMFTLKNLSNILLYNEYIDTEDTVKIITPYLEDAELLANIQNPSIELSFIVFKQIAHALETLEKHGVVHHDVSEHTIIVQHVSGQYNAYLTGFSEFHIENGSTASFRHDLSCLASTVTRMLPIYDGRPCCEPSFLSLLSSSIQKDISPSQAGLRVEGIVAGFTGWPFKTLWLTKEMSIKRIVDKNDLEGLRLLDFLRIVLHYKAQDVRTLENSIKKVIRRERLFELGTEIYCYLEDAERLLHHIQSLHLSTLMLDLHAPRHAEPCWYETKHTIIFPVSYHERSQMVNISQVLNLSNDEEARSCVKGILPAVQELRGSRQWEGYYIDIESTNQVFGRLGLTIGGALGDSPVFPCAFHDNDSDHFGIVATTEMIGFLLLSRDGKTVKEHWNGYEQTTNDAIQVYTDHGLDITQRAIREGVKPELEWTSHYNSEQIMNLFEGEAPSEATEHNSFVFSTPSCFAFKKRETPDVPDLPLPGGHLVEQVARRVRCKAWLQASHDIYPTKFTKNSIVHNGPKKVSFKRGGRKRG